MYIIYQSLFLFLFCLNEETKTIVENREKGIGFFIVFPRANSNAAYEFYFKYYNNGSVRRRKLENETARMYRTLWHWFAAQ